MLAVADTSGLLALFNRTEPEHDSVAAAANACGLVVISPLTLTEVHEVAGVRAGRDVADAILRTLCARIEASRVAIAPTTSRTMSSSLRVRGRYRDLDLDLADAVAVVVAAEYRTEVVLTLDRRDFRAMAPLTDHRAFRLLPDDL